MLRGEMLCQRKVALLKQIVLLMVWDLETNNEALQEMRNDKNEIYLSMYFVYSR